jgi:GAF domain-containing protein
MVEQRGEAEELRLAHETIAHQALEIEALSQALDGSAADRQLATELRHLLRQASVAAALGEPAEADELLESLVQTAALVTSAQAASLLQLDSQGGHLVFRVALGPKAAAVRQFTVPLGRGIVGLVAETGQPMAISNVSEDPRFFREIAQSVHYTPESILCVPLRRDDGVIGVLELLDKTGGSFTAQDMEVAGRFARQMALAMEQSRGVADLSTLLLTGLRRLAGDQNISATLEQEIVAFARRTQDGDRQTEALARAIAAIARQGEAEVELLHAWVGAFLAYLRGRAALRYR